MFHASQLHVLVLFVPCTDGVGGGVGVFPVFMLSGNPLIDMDLRNACTRIVVNPSYCIAVPQTCVP